jgi:DNA-binding IclR family transcriptional regulator
MSERGEVYDRLSAWVDSEHERGTSPFTLTVMLAKHAVCGGLACGSPREKFMEMIANDWDELVAKAAEDKKTNDAQ